MESFSAVIALWPNRDALAEDCGTTYGVVKQWDRRGSIPAAYWPRLVEGAKRRGYRGVTEKVLAEIAAKSLHSAADHQAAQ